jgi:Ca-activated chloride channel family protein
MVLLVFALMRPREGSQHSRITTKGVVLSLVVDRSSSMETKIRYRGESMSRLEVVKRVSREFVLGSEELEGRTGDMIGLITFAGYADTMCPLVQAHDAVVGFLEDTNTVQLESEDGTAIGDGLALAAARLHKAEVEIQERNAKLLAEESGEGEVVKPEFTIQSKVIVLMTDGINNRGRVSPLEAAELAKEWGIKVYTIGIGGQEQGRQVQGLFGSFRLPTGRELDERLLQEIAQKTGGFYGRADDAEGLREIYQKIDELEKSEIESVEYSSYEERFGGWALAALCVLGLEMMLGYTIFRKIP